MKNDFFSIGKPATRVVGTGLIALDIVLNGRSTSPVGLWAGGTCGNVLTILAFLGWESYPVARLKDNEFADGLINDVRKWKVNTSFIAKADSGSTPIIVERIRNSRDGTPHHRFEWCCPTCGAALPVYRPVLARETNDICRRLPNTDIFFFDRVARSSVMLAKHCRERGALIIFEPSSVKDEKLFRECVAVAHIVKYSHQHSSRLHNIKHTSGVRLEIETLGSKGLRYRFGDIRGGGARWSNVRCYEVEEFKDTVGSGDWLTAGIIHRIGQMGQKGFAKVDDTVIKSALEFGQALSAVNCQFEGARGSMYLLSKQEFINTVKNVLEHGRLTNVFETTNTKITDVHGMCPKCPT